MYISQDIYRASVKNDMLPAICNALDGMMKLINKIIDPGDFREYIPRRFHFTVRLYNQFITWQMLQQIFRERRFADTMRSAYGYFHHFFVKFDYGAAPGVTVNWLQSQKLPASAYFAILIFTFLFLIRSDCIS